MKRMPLPDLLEMLKGDAQFRGQLLQEFSEYSTRSLAASFVIAARKPVGWREAQLLWRREPALAEKSELARREYYELRMTVILRHHEVFLYERFCHENGIDLTLGEMTHAEPVREILARCRPADILGHDSVLEANEALREAEQVLRVARDERVKLYHRGTTRVSR